MTTRSGPLIALGIIVVGVLVAGFLPTFVDDPLQTRELTTTQSNDTEIIVYNNLNATVTEVTSTNATVELKDTVDGNTSTVIVPDGSFNETTLSESTVNVSAKSVTADTQAELTYSYPPTFGWEGGPKFIVGNLSLVLIGLLLFSILLLLATVL